MIAKAVRAFFERVATDRDAMRLAYYDERVIEKMAAVSGLIGAMIAADVGTGTGFVAAGLAPWAGTVVGGDNSPAMPAASRNLDPLGVRNVELVEGDAAALPPESGSVDAAFDNMVLHDAEDPGAMLEEMARVVRPGGTVAITDEVEHPYRWMREEHADARLGLSEGQLGASSGGGPDRLRVRALGDAAMHPLHDLGGGRPHRDLCHLGDGSLGCQRAGRALRPCRRRFLRPSWRFLVDFFEVIVKLCWVTYGTARGGETDGAVRQQRMDGGDRELLRRRSHRVVRKRQPRRDLRHGQHG